MRHFLFEEKEYRINPRFKRRRQEPDSAQLLARLLKPRSSRKTGRRGGGIRKVDVRQKCVAKMQYSSSLDAHRVQLEKYLCREGTERDGSRAKLYGTDLEEYRQNMAGKNFRIFLSPQSDRIDLSALAERFVMKLEASTGYKLYWQAANHYNTAHPHAHLLINGRDKNGKEVEFPRDVVKTFMREYARDICTAQIGPRTLKDLELEKEQELTANRFTSVDKKIKALCGGTFRVNIADKDRDRERILTRLVYLQKLKLCVYKDGGYKLSPRWEDDLKANGRYNSFLKARTVLRYSPPSSLRLYSGLEGSITGKAVKVYRTDGDASDNHAVVLEGLDGKAYFVPLFKKPEFREGDKKTALREGDFISVRTYETQRGRLTPALVKREDWQIRREIKKNGFSGSLAAEVLKNDRERIIR
ncbi:MAG: DUF3363 domain-containing protein [Spirochaetaceae bacterium]|jgi:hypothetical protein|nr:DUF3363 domain-containing protein [Spirochaetaceae bacterium]